MKFSSALPTLATFAVAAAIAVLSARVAVTQIERSSVEAVDAAMTNDGHDWVTVTADGLQLDLSGRAPDEAARFQALSLAGSIVDSTRVIDGMEVEPGESIVAPRFSIEVLRNEDGIMMMGLIPEPTDRAALLARIGGVAQGAGVTDLLQTAAFDGPPGWDDALEFGIGALGRLPRSKVSIAADMVEVTAISESRATKRRLETELARQTPDGVQLVLDISAPRPVITPFTLRFLIDDSGARFDACSAATAEGRAKILTAAAAAGLREKTDCTIGIGVPSVRWADASSSAIAALADIGGGSVTLSDGDVTIVALAGTERSVFNQAVGSLEGALPAGFSLFSILPDPPDASPDTALDFTATLEPDGQLELRGRIADDRARTAVNSFAKARFGIAKVVNALQTDDEVPDGWSPRVLAALDSLSLLVNGSVVVKPELVEVRGTTGDPGARAEISRILSAELGSAENFRLFVRYDEKLDPELGLPTPEECVAQINEVLTTRKITFDPGSADIAGEGAATVDSIAELLRTCDDVAMEIGGYTDSQGRESMNQQLSQARASAVVEALAARRVRTGLLNPVGYGEDFPIETNETEDGREANRRIEFKLIVPETEEAPAPQDETADADTSAPSEDDNEQD